MKNLRQQKTCEESSRGIPIVLSIFNSICTFSPINSSIVYAIHATKPHAQAHTYIHTHIHKHTHTHTCTVHTHKLTSKHTSSSDSFWWSSKWISACTSSTSFLDTNGHGVMRICTWVTLRPRSLNVGVVSSTCACVCVCVCVCEWASEWVNRDVCVVLWVCGRAPRYFCWGEYCRRFVACVHIWMLSCVCVCVVVACYTRTCDMYVCSGVCLWCWVASQLCCVCVCWTMYCMKYRTGTELLTVCMRFVCYGVCICWMTVVTTYKHNGE